MAVEKNRWTRRQFMKFSALAAAQMAFVSRLSFAGIRAQSPTQMERQQRLQNSPQYREGKFANPIVAPVMVAGSTWAYIKKRFFTSHVGSQPTAKLPLKPINANDWISTDKENLVFAWLGHSSILMAIDAKTILVDPVLAKRASPFSWIGPKRFHPAPVAVGGLPPIDVVLITHDHYDHLEASTIKRLAGKTSLFLVPLGIGELLEEWKIAPNKIVELDWWEHRKVGSLIFTATPAVHYARRGLFDGDERLWCSWSVQGRKQKAFISGDSGYFDGFKKIGEKMGPFDATFLKVGSYDQLWKQIHMTPEEAVQQHLDLNGSTMVPLHWATFDLALHPWYEPVERALVTALEKGVTLSTPKIGQQVNLKQPPKVKPWWRTPDRQTG